MTSDFILYGSPHSQFTYKVALMLRLSRKPFAFRYVSFQKGMHNLAFTKASGIDVGRWKNVSDWVTRVKALPHFKGPFNLLSMADAERA